MRSDWDSRLSHRNPERKLTHAENTSENPGRQSWTEENEQKRVSEYVKERRGGGRVERRENDMRRIKGKKGMRGEANEKQNSLHAKRERETVFSHSFGVEEMRADGFFPAARNQQHPIQFHVLSCSLPDSFPLSHELLSK